MKSKLFEVPAESVIEFAEKMLELELVNRITGTGDETLEIEIRYDSGDKEALYELMEWFDEHVESES